MSDYINSEKARPPKKVQLCNNMKYLTKINIMYFNIMNALVMIFSTFLIPITTMYFIVAFIIMVTEKPAAQIYSLTLTVFGIAAALAGICFTMSQNPSDAGPVRYAGEKFLHVSLLLIQVVLVLYIKQTMTESAWIQNHATFIIILNKGLNVATILIATAASFFWFYGFEALNGFLWKNYKERMDGTYKGEGVKKEIIP